MYAEADNNIYSRYQDLMQETKLRARDAAARLGVSEAELVSSMPGSIRLRSDFPEILRALPSLGEVLALTRNESAVHEKRGVYPEPSINGHVGLFHSKNIDLRVFLLGWQSGFAVRDEARGQERRSLQFFDPKGDAVHKIWLEEKSDVAAFDALVENFAAQEAEVLLRDFQDPVDRPDADIDVEGLRAAWSEMKDTHQFYGILRRFEVGRLQAMRLVAGDWARKVPNSITQAILQRASETQVPIMVFVGNRGLIQIHAGPIERFSPKGEWLNIFDHEFGMHLRNDHIHSSWIVRKPTSDGDVTSVELFDEAGREIGLLFGDRKPGTPEAASWRALLRDVEGALDV